MPSTSRCGQPLPLPADFDYVAWTTRLDDVPPLPNMSLREQNQENIRIENDNASSVGFTRAYENASKTGAAPDGLDVGPPLRPFYAYSDQAKDLLVFSDQLRSSVSPLPNFLTEYIASEQLKKAESDAAEKAKKERERAEKEAEKAKANQSILGTKVMKNPHLISSALKSPVKIPNIFLMSLHHDVHFPLHWWSDQVIKDAYENAGSIPTHQIDAEQTASLVKPEKVLVVDVVKAAKILGEEGDGPTLTPNEWRGASQNVLEALRLICAPVDPEKPETKNTHYSEYELHVKFFANLEQFESMYEVWYRTERELRKRIFADGLFSLDYYSTKNICFGYPAAHPAPAANILDL
ncbi:hypothetical protein R3P38DRAFT_3366088 [Favolaschia claudopus]|uniref:Uncharacterized protein n=1 Tax=Favolaschia claudopus TaxID=2862362 RepID=A0AAW0AE88_9AGAR